MKFLTFTLAALVAVTHAAPAVKTQKLGGTSVRGGLNKRKIMENAVKVNRQGERVLEQAEFALTSAYSLQFNTCVSLKTEPSDGDLIFSEDLMGYTSAGTLVPQKSFILFNVCESKYCDYYASDDNLYMVDVGTYMAAISEFYEDRSEKYCEACANSVNYCAYVNYQKANTKNYNQVEDTYQDYKDNTEEEAADEEAADEEAADEEAADEEYEEYEGRKLSSRYNYEVIDCDVCDAMNCYMSNEEAEEGEDGYDDVDIADISDWVDTLTECAATESYFEENYLLYAGFMCNEDGSGVDIALFLDEECSIYNANVSFKNVASESDQFLMYEATDMITYPFLHKVNCNGDYEYYSMEEYRYAAQNYNGNANNSQEAGDASDYCQSLFAGGDAGEAVSLRNCAQDGYADEDEAEEEEADDYNYYAEEYSDADYNWYSFVLSYEDSQDTAATCKIIKQLQGEYEMIYKWNGSGQLYDYGTNSNNPTTHSDYSQNVKNFFSSYDKIDASLLAAVAIGSLIAMMAFFCIMYSCCSANSVPNKYTQHKKQLEAHRREILVDSSTGQMLM